MSGRSHPKAAGYPRLVVDGDRFAAGDRIAGLAVVGPEPGDARVELIRGEPVHDTIVFDNPLVVHPLRAGLADVEQAFSIEVPDGPREHAGWTVRLVINRVQRASVPVRIA